MKAILETLCGCHRMVYVNTMEKTGRPPPLLEIPLATGAKAALAEPFSMEPPPLPGIWVRRFQLKYADYHTQVAYYMETTE